ncbi:unnamed protein product [Aphanomyces euteiches]
MTDKDLAKWKRRIEENRYIREHLLDKANLLVYTIQSLSARPRPLGIVDLYTIWRLVGQGYNVNERDDNGIPPLVHCAVGDSVRHLVDVDVVQEKEAQLRGLQAKESDAAPSRPPPPTPPPAIAEATVEPETKQNSRLARLADERRAQQSQLMEEALARQTDMYLKSIRPAHKEETPMQAAVHTEWRKVKPHKWKLVGLPPKRESSTRVDMRRIQQLTALDDLDEETPTTIDAMATFAIKHQPKPARFKFFCPQFE